MLLSARMLQSVSSANDYEYVDNASASAGDTYTVYFQLIDASKDRSERGYSPAGRAYFPAAGSTMSVTLDNLDDSIKISNRTATQPYPTNPSIWAVNINASDKISGTCTLRIKLTQASVVTYGTKEAALLIY